MICQFGITNDVADSFQCDEKHYMLKQEGPWFLFAPWLWVMFSRLNLQPAQPPTDQPSPRGRDPSTTDVNRLLRKSQTEKARTAALLKKQSTRLFRKHIQPQQTESPAETTLSVLQTCFFTSHFSKAEYDADRYNGDNKSFTRDRARCVFSLMKAVASTLCNLFSPGSGDQAVFHVLNTHIVDDTSTRMRGPSSSDRTTVYTIMNTIQGLHFRVGICDDDVVYSDFADPKTCVSFRVPTPLLVLENPNTKGIHESFTGSAIITARGVGQMIERFGLPKSIAAPVPWKTFVFIGDALKANNAAFRKECQEILKHKESLGNHLALRVRCAIHQVCLIRKPIVLMIPKLWTTVVRLAHLFENLSFRKAFARTLASIVQQSFAYLQVQQLPTQSPEWHATREMLRGTFRSQSNSKLRREHFLKCLDFFNGDLRSECVFHFCIDSEQRPCCKGAQDSLSKCLKLIVPFLARGYCVPLLYRFKHYDEAVSFLTFGCAVHKLLLRTLGQMDLERSANSQEMKLVESLLEDVNLAGDADDGTAATTFNDDPLSQSENFQSFNAKRKQLVHQEITRAGFSSSTDIVNFMIKPMDDQINQLFHRSALLTKLTLLGPNDERWKENMLKSKGLFQSIVSGDFGWRIIGTYTNKFLHELSTLELTQVDLGNAKNMDTLFVMMLLIITDTWKRFVHDYAAAYPFKLFQLLTDDVEQFVASWDAFQQDKLRCAKCMDAAFSKTLLDAFPAKLGLEGFPLQKSVYHKVQLLLNDIAVFSPLTSDPVEIKNGQVQHSSSRRGNQAVKMPLASKETSFLNSAIRDFELLKHFVEEKTLPARKVTSGILKRVGMFGSNQFSFEEGKVGQGKTLKPVAWLSFGSQLCLFFFLAISKQLAISERCQWGLFVG